jgi:hypothetical protein
LGEDPQPLIRWTDGVRPMQGNQETSPARHAEEKEQMSRYTLGFEKRQVKILGEKYCRQRGN